MIVSSLQLPAMWNPFLDHPILERSLAWIRERAENSQPGKYELGEPGWFVGVDGYSTKAVEECQWENHLQTIDLQYLMEGVEGIKVLPVALLGEPVLYKEASDTQKFGPTLVAASLVVLHPGDFAVFMPGEAHCPKIAIGDPELLRKLVVKIPLHLLEPR